jgi:outer membrane murein-binding lipoprotein Lpp
MTIVQRNPISDGWSFVEPRHEDLELGYELDRRIKERVGALEAEAELARSEEATLNAEVDRLRGDVALGLATRSDLLAASKRLAKAQNRVGDAESAVRAGQRWERREREAHVEASRARSRAAYHEAHEAIRGIRMRAVVAIQSFVAEVDRIEADISTVNATYRAPGNEPVMRSPFGAIRDELDRRARNLGAAQ